LRRYFRQADIYGPSLREGLSEAARPRVRFTGSVAHAETPPFYWAAAIFVFPPVWDEPFGLPVIEAMAAGLPVVATDVGGIRDTVVDGVTGLLVTPGDPQELAAAINRLLTDEALAKAMGRAGRARVRDHFSWDRRADEWVTAYQSLLQPAERRRS
jgi:glycosyltransferase involved in cell wall biosynthesis